MRILFLTLARFPTDEAPAVQVANMAQAFSDLGHHVVLVAPAGSRTRPSEQVQYAESGTSSASLAQRFGFTPTFRIVQLSRRLHRGQSYLHALRLHRMAQRGEVDLVFSRNLRACLLPALRGLPTVFEAHTLTALQGRQDRWILRRLQQAPGFRGLVAVSQALADDLRDVLAIDERRILVAHDAVRLNRGDHHSSEPRTASTPVRVGYTGSLYPGKGADILLSVAADCPWAHFEIAGGPEARADDLRLRADRDGIRNVTIHGEIAPTEARSLQQRCDVLVAPFSRRIESDSGVDISRWTSPMKLFEYMASGRPIVISDLPVLREVLRPDLDALMVPPEDSEALALALRRIADDPELGARLAASALERVTNEFTWELRARRILERFAPEATGSREPRVASGS